MRSFNKIYYVWFVFAILILGGLTTLGFFYKSKISKYEDYESVLISSATTYIENEAGSLKKGETTSLSINKLIKLGYLESEDVIDECTGSVLVSFNRTISYEPNIKCGYYKSKQK